MIHQRPRCENRPLSRVYSRGERGFSHLGLLINHNLLLLFLLFVSFSACSTSPVPTGAELPAVFASVEVVQPYWQPFENGINYFHGKITSPRLEFWALQIDLSAPGLEIVVGSGAVNSDQQNSQTLSTRVSSFVHGNNLIAGINASPFDVISSRERQPIQNIGIVVSGGELTAPAHPHYDALVFYKDGKAAIVNQSAIVSIENIKNAIGGFFEILTEGEPAQITVINETTISTGAAARHPRSAAGISQDGKYLYLLVIDGRRAGSIGSTRLETALLLYALGSWTGINLDGGGSSALAMRVDGKVKVINTPIHGGIPGLERAVAGCIGARISTPE